MKKYRLLFLFMYFLIMALSDAFLLGSANADARLDLFLKQYEALAGRALPAEHPDNPLHPYIGIHFDFGLDDKDRREMTLAQKNFQCLRVQALLVKGFLQLYPFLAPAFSYDNLERMIKLEFLVSGDYGFAVSRCQTMHVLKELWTRRDPADFPPLDMALEITDRYGEPAGPKPAPDQQILFKANFRLGYQAFCYDYPPMIGDVRAFANKNGGMAVTAEEQLYLTERARINGLISDVEYRQEIDNFAERSMPPARRRYLREASRHLDMHEIIAVKGFWWSACQKLVGERKKRLRLRAGQ